MKDRIKEILVDVYQIDGRLEDEAAERILRLFSVSGSCDHSLIDARNDIIQSGYMCIKCNALFRANDH